MVDVKQEVSNLEIFSRHVATHFGVAIGVKHVSETEQLHTNAKTQPTDCDNIQETEQNIDDLLSVEITENFFALGATNKLVES